MERFRHRINDRDQFAVRDSAKAPSGVSEGSHSTTKACNL